MSWEGLPQSELLAEGGKVLTGRAAMLGILSYMETGQTKAHFSLPSIIAIAAAVASFFVGAGGGFILALVAIVFGIFGVLLSMAPSVRGGFISVLAFVAGAIGIVVAVIKALAWAL
jgi:hypothetical protein